LKVRHKGLDIEEVFVGASCCTCEVCPARKSQLFSQAINALFFCQTLIFSVEEVPEVSR